MTALNEGDNSTQRNFDNGNFQIELNSIKTSENNGNYFGGTNNEDMTTIVATSSETETTAAVLKAFENATSSLTINRLQSLSTINSEEELVLDRILSNNTSFVSPVSVKTSNRYFFHISSKKLFSYDHYSMPNSTMHNLESQSFYESNFLNNSLNTNGEEQGIKLLIFNYYFKKYVNGWLLCLFTIIKYPENRLVNN